MVLTIIQVYDTHFKMCIISLFRVNVNILEKFSL